MRLFAIPVFSFVPSKYRKLVKESGGRIFAALLICFVLLGLLTAVPAFFGFRDVMGILREECPYFALKNHQLYIEKPLLIDQDGTYLRIDDSIEDVTVYDVDALSTDHSDVILIGRSGGGFYQNGMIRVFDYKNVGDFDKNSLFDAVLPILNVALAVGFLLAPFFSIGVYYLVALILQFLTGALSSGIFKYDLTKEERFRITVLAKFPPHLLVCVLRFFGVNIGAMVNLLLQIAFISFVLYSFLQRGDDAPAENIIYAE